MFYGTVSNFRNFCRFPIDGAHIVIKSLGKLPSFPIDTAVIVLI